MGDFVRRAGLAGLVGLAVHVAAGPAAAGEAAPAPATNQPAPAITPNQPSLLEEAVEAYQRLTARTVLRPSSLPDLTNSLGALPTDRTNAVAQLEAAFAKNGLTLVADGPVFTRLIPATLRDSFTNAPWRGAELHSAVSVPGSSEKPNPALLPASALNLPSVSLDQVLPLYAQLRGRAVLRPAKLPPALLRLKTASPLTREEAAYALATDLALNGLVAVDDGDKFVQVVSAEELPLVRTNAPKLDLGAALLDPNQKPESPLGPVPASDTLRYQKLFYQFMHGPTAHRRLADHLLAFCAELLGKTALPSPGIGAASVRFDVDIPLTRKELLYAIQTTLALNQLAIVPVNDSSLRLRHLSRRK